MPPSDIKEIRDDIQAIKTSITKIELTINGNGVRGLCQRVTDLETAKDKQQKVDIALQGNTLSEKRLRVAIYALFVTSGGMVITLILNLLQFIRG